MFVNLLHERREREQWTYASTGRDNTIFGPNITVGQTEKPEKKRNDSIVQSARNNEANTKVLFTAPGAKIVVTARWFTGTSQSSILHTSCWSL